MTIQSDLKAWDDVCFGDLFQSLRTVALSRDQLTDEGAVGYIHYGDIHTKWDTYLDLRSC